MAPAPAECPATPPPTPCQPGLWPSAPATAPPLGCATIIEPRPGRRKDDGGRPRLTMPVDVGDRHGHRAAGRPPRRPRGRAASCMRPRQPVPCRCAAGVHHGRRTVRSPRAGGRGARLPRGLAAPLPHHQLPARAHARPHGRPGAQRRALHLGGRPARGPHPVARPAPRPRRRRLHGGRPGDHGRHAGLRQDHRDRRRARRRRPPGRDLHPAGQPTAGHPGDHHLHHRHRRRRWSPTPRPSRWRCRASSSSPPTRCWWPTTPVSTSAFSTTSWACCSAAPSRGRRSTRCAWRAVCTRTRAARWPTSPRASTRPSSRSIAPSPTLRPPPSCCSSSSPACRRRA